jgi:hypothetical protein
MGDPLQTMLHKQPHIDGLGTCGNAENCPTQPAWHLVAIFGLFALCALIYSSVFATHYAFSDDYDFIWRDRTPGYIDQTCAAQGRPIDGVILRACYRRATVNGMDWIRLAGVSGVGLEGWITYLAMCRSGFKVREAFIAGLIVCTLPASQVGAA